MLRPTLETPCTAAEVNGSGVEPFPVGKPAGDPGDVVASPLAAEVNAAEGTLLESIAFV